MKQKKSALQEIAVLSTVLVVALAGLLSVFLTNEETTMPQQKLKPEISQPTQLLVQEEDFPREKPQTIIPEKPCKQLGLNLVSAKTAAGKNYLGCVIIPQQHAQNIICC